MGLSARKCGATQGWRCHNWRKGGLNVPYTRVALHRLALFQDGVRMQTVRCQAPQLCPPRARVVLRRHAGTHPHPAAIPAPP